MSQKHFALTLFSLSIASWTVASSSAGAASVFYYSYCVGGDGSMITSKGVADKCCSGSDLTQRQDPPPEGCPGALSNAPAQQMVTLAAGAKLTDSMITAARNLLSTATGNRIGAEDLKTTPSTPAAATAAAAAVPLSERQDSAGSLSAAGAIREISKKGTTQAPEAMTGSALGFSPGAGTQPNTEAAKAAVGTSMMNTGAGTVQSSGNVPNARLSGGSPGAMSFGGLGGLGGAASDATNDSAKNTSFGTQSASPLASSDPEDYFTRIDTNESIFRIVEKRYISKQTEWITGDLRDTAQSLKNLGRQ